jgi:hypothetical protein
MAKKPPSRQDRGGTKGKGPRKVLETRTKVARATIPDARGVIHGCYSTRTGALRVVGTGATCSASEASLTWNQTGPKGPAGASGVSSAISVHRAEVGPISSPDYVTIITANDVPAGAYMVVAKTRIDHTQTVGSDCQLVYNAGAGDVVADTTSQSPYNSAVLAIATHNLEALIQLGAPGKVFVQSRVGGPIGGFFARHSKIILIKVQSATDAEVTS